MEKIVKEYPKKSLSFDNRSHLGYNILNVTDKKICYIIEYLF